MKLRKIKRILKEELDKGNNYEELRSVIDFGVKDSVQIKHRFRWTYILAPVMVLLLSVMIVAFPNRKERNIDEDDEDISYEFIEEDVSYEFRQADESDNKGENPGDDNSSEIHSETDAARPEENKKPKKPEEKGKEGYGYRKFVSSDNVQVKETTIENEEDFQSFLKENHLKLQDVKKYNKEYFRTQRLHCYPAKINEEIDEITLDEKSGTPQVETNKSNKEDRGTVLYLIDLPKEETKASAKEDNKTK